ncbi:MAG: tetratricopeptide repeat protein, partial [Opitutaceae bacterium]
MARETELFTTRLIVSNTGGIVQGVRGLRVFPSIVTATGFVIGAMFVAGARAQDALTPATPLSKRTSTAGEAAANVTLAAAQRAQDFGLPSLAADIYRQLLKAPGADSTSVRLALATALIDAGEAPDAEEALAAVPEPHGADWRLRTGLAALQLGK